MFYAMMVIVSVSTGSPLVMSTIVPAQECAAMVEQTKESHDTSVVCIDLRQLGMGVKGEE
jgi:hypothetical protein